jgi:hypothetical protein
MPYHMDDRSLDLGALQRRLEDTDLIPSQLPLRDGLSAKMTLLNAAGISSMADLRTALKTSKSLTTLSQRSGIDPEYLKLLKRTIGGFFPKPRSLGEVDWLGSDTVNRLRDAGIKNTQQLFEASTADAAGLAAQTGADPNDLQELAAISDLCRIQWVSPSFARVLTAAGFESPAAIARADPEGLFEALVKANEGAKFHKGKVGLRDIRRLVAAAAYVP